MPKDYYFELFKLDHRLEGVVNGIDHDLIAILEKSLEEVEAKSIKLVAKAGETESLMKRRQYLNQQRKAIKTVLDQTYKDIGIVIEDRAVEVGQATPRISKKILTESLSGPVKARVSTDFVTPSLSKEKVLKVLRSAKIEGAYFKGILTKLSNNAVQRIVSESLVSVILNEPLNETTKRIEKAVYMGRDSAKRIAQDAVNISYNFGERETRLANAKTGFMQYERFDAMIDARTTPGCQALDGEVFPIGKAPIPVTETHSKCRSHVNPTFGPDVDKQITGRQAAEITTSDGYKRPYKGVRHKRWNEPKFTDLKPGEKYSQFLSRMAKSKNPDHIAFAKEVMGPKRLELFQSGKISIDKLYYRGKFRNIKQLEAMT